MRRLLGMVTMLAALSALGSCAGTYSDTGTVDVGVAVDIRNAPPPPPIRWDRRPMLREIHSSSVYLVDDPAYDVFMYGGAYYTYWNGYWYRADDDRSGFVVIDSRSVPGPVLHVPARNWKHRSGSRHDHRRRAEEDS